MQPNRFAFNLIIVRKTAMFCMNLRLNPSASQRLTEKYSINFAISTLYDNIWGRSSNLSLCSGLQCSCPRYCVCHLYVPTVCRVTWIYIQCIIVCLCRVHSTAYKHKQTQGLNAAARKTIVHLQNAPQYTALLISKNSRVLQLWLNH